MTLCGIGMAIGAFLVLVGFSSAFEHEWMRIYSSGGTDIAVIQQTFLGTSVDESVVAKLKALPIVQQATPLIYNVMDVTPEVNAPTRCSRSSFFRDGPSATVTQR